MSKHSPAPWRIRPDPPILDVIIFDETFNFVARVYAGRRQDADARLIAAAPDLLAVAEEFDRLALVIESAVREARSPDRHAAVLAALKANHTAIAKAKGEPDAQA